MKLYIICFITGLIGLIFQVPEIYYFIFIGLGVTWAIKYIVKDGLEKLRFSRTISQDKIFRGEKARVNLKLSNNSIWPIFWLSFYEQVPVKLHSPLQNNIISLAPNEEWELSYTLQGKRRGFYDIGVASGKLGDSLGLLKKEFNLDTEQELLVYPKIFPLDELALPSRIAFGDLIWPQRIYRDRSSFRGLREYQKGDRIKDVYWPATASSNQLMVKEYESTIVVESLIFLNLNQQDYGVEKLRLKIELAIEVAASVANYLIDRNQTIGLATNGEDKINGQHFLEPAQGSAHFMKMMELLARVEKTEERSYLELIEEYSHQAPLGSTLLLITELDTEALITKALQLCQAGLNVVIIILGNDVVHKKYLNRSHTENLVIYQVKRKEDIYAWGS
jgi:uncharacterized protein (DUF58 family)